MSQSQRLPFEPRPGREGLLAAGRLERDEQRGRPHGALRFSQQAALADLSKEWAFFTHSLLFTPVVGSNPVTQDPVQEWCNHQQDKDLVASLLLPEPLFAGLAVLGDDVYNRTLLACRQEAWLSLRAHLSDLTLVDRPRHTVWRTFWHAIEVVDVRALERMTVLPVPLPMVPVTSIGVTGNRGEWGLLTPAAGATPRKPPGRPAEPTAVARHQQPLPALCWGPAPREYILWARDVLANRPTTLPGQPTLPSKKRE